MSGKEYKETTNGQKLYDLLLKHSNNKEGIEGILYFLPTEEARQKMIDFIEQGKPSTMKEIAKKVPEFGNLRRVVPVES